MIIYKLLIFENKSIVFNKVFEYSLIIFIIVHINKNFKLISAY
jgi:hypothetical protein